MNNKELKEQLINTASTYFMMHKTLRDNNINDTSYYIKANKILNEYKELIKFENEIEYKQVA